MNASIVFFPVDNGDMTLLTLSNGQTLLIDIRVRKAADDRRDPTPDVITQLRSRLRRDAFGRMYVDGFLLSHPDMDHIAGLVTHFHLGSPEDWDPKGDKIIIREMWSSPIVFRRASKYHTLCDDAKAWATEARRRVKLFRASGAVEEGDRILVLGEDEDGKTDDIGGIVAPADSRIVGLNGVVDGSFEARLLGPLTAGDLQSEERLAKNESSVILRFSLAVSGAEDRCRFLTGGDAEVAIWERLWELHGVAHADWLSYDLLQAPHHCSWHTLSYDSYSDFGEDAEVNVAARNALAQVRKGSVVIASSKRVQANDADPPCERAKREYINIVGAADRFICVADIWEKDRQPLEYEIGLSGPIKKARGAADIAASVVGIGVTGSSPRGHG